MAGISLVNKITFSNKFGQYLGLAALASGIYFFGPKVYNLADNMVDNVEKINAVEDALKKDDLELASRLLNSYERSRSMSEEDLVKFRLQIDRRNGIREFNGAIRQGENAARPVLERLVNSKIYDSAILSRFRKQLNDSTEQGSFSRLDHAPVDERIELSQRYLRVYPNGLHNKVVVQHLFVDNFSRLFDYFDRAADYEATRRQIATLNLLMQQYGDMNIPLSRLVPIDDLLSKYNKYVRNLSNENPQGKVQVGSVVRILDINWQNIHYNNNYLRIRDTNYLVGSIGEVVSADRDEDEFCVRFNGVKRKQGWRDYDHCSKSWRGNRKNIAAYEEEELRLMSPLNEIDKLVLQQDLETLRNNFGGYR